MLPPAGFEKVTREIIFMQTLHHDDDGARLFVVEPGDQRAAVPIDHALARGRGERLFGFQRIVDNNQIRAAAGQCAAYRSRISTAAGGGYKFRSRVPCWAHRGEQMTIPRRIDHHPELPMQLGCEVIGIADNDNAASRIVSQQPRNIGDRNRQGFQRARRLVDQETATAAALDFKQLMNDRLNVPVGKIRTTGENGIEGFVEEGEQVGSEQRGNNIIHLSSSSLLSTGNKLASLRMRWLCASRIA